MSKILSMVNDLVWGVPALVLILGVGGFLTVRLGVPQVRLFPRAIRLFCAQFRKRPGEGVSAFQALCTALAATVGTGNLVGVAGAICLGGPGAVFWMWVSGFLGMATKFSETVLALHYRVKTGDGWAGGPMYTIEKGLGKKWRPMAVCYCIFGLIASFGVGSAAQINAVVSSVNGLALSTGKRPTLWLDLGVGLVLGLWIYRLLRGGSGPVARAAERLVPVAAAGYILLCTFALIAGRKALPGAVTAVFRGAFQPRAVTGGLLGSAFRALRVGCSRGVFTNEAGMGTASIAHASAQVPHPADQGLLGMVEVFLDTIVICTLTALVILVSGVEIPYGLDAGGDLTTLAFSRFYGKWAGILLGAFLICFAVATVLGWGFYGGRCLQFLLGKPGWKAYALAQLGAVVAASVADTAAVWQFSETVNGLMAIPNLLALGFLAPELVQLTKEYGKKGRK